MGTSKRWPPLVATAIAAVLVFLVLPNPLRIPQQNPTASAEYAPVPGRTQQSGQSNFAETNLATSSGIGASGEGIGQLPGQLEELPPQFKPRQKQCVGNPPRQTEDPLSPPCVPFFEGDNGGNTYPGVTKDDILVYMYNDRCCDGDMTTPWKPSDEQRCRSIYTYECENIVRTVKAQLRYFQKRYQTYGRTVRMIAQRSSGDLGAECGSRQGDAEAALIEGTPFGVLNVMLNGNEACYMQVMRKRDIPSFGIEWSLDQEAIEKNRPFVWGFWNGPETRAQNSAGFICRKLLNETNGKRETAAYAGDSAYHDVERKIGFIRPQGESRGPELPAAAEMLVEQLDKQCGYSFDEERYYDASSNGGQGAGGREASQIMADFKRLGVTTIVCYCYAVPSELTAGTMQKTATSINYNPEWYWDCCLASASSMQEYGSAEQRSFGISTHWRQPAFREQQAWQAYAAEEPGTAPNSAFNFSIYTLFLNLFQAIQAAGPDLTPETVERGMFTFNYLDRSNPWLPVGGYGPYNKDAIASYNFIDTSMAWSWDPTGTPPGGRRGEGCQRVVRGGLRAYAWDWPRGDDDLFGPNDPCTSATSKIADPAAGGGLT